MRSHHLRQPPLLDGQYREARIRQRRLNYLQPLAFRRRVIQEPPNRMFPTVLVPMRHPLKLKLLRRDFDLRYIPRCLSGGPLPAREPSPTLAQFQSLLILHQFHDFEVQLKFQRYVVVLSLAKVGRSAQVKVLNLLATLRALLQNVLWD